MTESVNEYLLSSQNKDRVRDWTDCIYLCSLLFKFSGGSTAVILHFPASIVRNNFIKVKEISHTDLSNRIQKQLQISSRHTALFD